MRSIQIPKAGDQSVFRIIHEQAKAPKGDEVLIDVYYSGINFADIIMRQGLYQDAPVFPFVPGYEISGVVESVGEEVVDFKAGDVVFAGCFFGGYSEKVLVPSWQVRKIPFSVDDHTGLQQAAATLVSFMTAYLALFEMLKIRPTEKILIDCATGSLGQMMVQLLQGEDVEIFGMTSSESKLGFLKDLKVSPLLGGIEQLSANEKFDCIVNSRGGKSIQLAQGHLNSLGRQVAIGASDMIRPRKANLLTVISTWWKMRQLNTIDMINQNIGFFGLNVLSLFEERKVLEKVMDQVDLLQLSSTVDKVFNFDQVGEAHQYIENRQSRGKVLLKWK